MANNVLQNVPTYQKAELALLQNSFVYIDKSNKKFKNFQNFTGNLGSTVTFDLRTRYVANDGLVVGAFQDTQQRVQSLAVDKARNVAYEFTDQERIFNVSEFMDEFGEAAIAELGTSVETDVALNNINHTYRAYGDGVTDITSYGQLARAVANYKDYGSAKTKLCGIIPTVKAPAIIDSGLSQFAVNRNNETAMSWELGEWDGVKWYTSNLLPTHTAGNVGQSQATLTVVSINAAGTQVVLSGATASDADAIKAGDKLTFQTQALRFLTFIGHSPSQQRVQVRATADAGADGSGNVTVDIFPALISTAGDPNQNLTIPVAAGQEVLVANSHISGLLFHEPALMLAMPRLPLQTPFPTGNDLDADSGASMRMYYGTKFGENLTGFVHDCIWGSTLVDEYAQELMFTI